MPCSRRFGRSRWLFTVSGDAKETRDKEKSQNKRPLLHGSYQPMTETVPLYATLPYVICLSVCLMQRSSQYGWKSNCRCAIGSLRA